MAEPAKKLKTVTPEAEKTRPDGANGLSKLVKRFNRLIVLALVVVVVGAGLAISHISAPKQKHCTTEACFDPAFKNCSQATFDHTIQPLGSIRYQVLYSDMRSGGCYVTVEYTQTSNQEWQDKPMTCVFNNQESLTKAAGTIYNDLLSGQNTYGCTGPLVTIIQQAGAASNQSSGGASSE
jgi:hypothetical protein